MSILNQIPGAYYQVWGVINCFMGFYCLGSLAARTVYWWKGQEFTEEWKERLPSIDYAFSSIFTGATTPLGVIVISFVAHRFFSDTQLEVFGASPSSLEWGNLRNAIGVLAIVCAMPSYYKDFFGEDGSFSKGAETVVISALTIPIGMHYTGSALKCIRAFLFKA